MSQEKRGKLILVALPIGNPDDITLRALDTLRSVDVIAAEDTRIARRLLESHSLLTPLVTYRQRADRDTIQPLLERLRAGERIALICDAGTPTIADPGQTLIQKALLEGFEIDAVPGPVAAIVALTLSGFATGRFAFDGFPPRSRADRQTFFRALQNETRTILLYESAAYLRATLHDLLRRLGPERRLLIATDLTRPTQTLYRGTLGSAAEERAHSVHGECTLVIEGGKDSEKI